MLINLVKDGIFPITKNADGSDIGEDLDTGYSHAGTFQGEGKLLGSACLFIRTSSCNLRCAWVGADGKGSPCDTPYSSHKPEKNRMEVDAIVDIVKANMNDMTHIVISGGEPTMQAEPLAELLYKLQRLGLHTTVETNGTIFDERVAKHVNLLSISPKLSTSAPKEANLKDTELEYKSSWVKKHNRLRVNIEAIQGYIDNCYPEFLGKANYDVYKHREHDFQLKFVVSSIDDIKEIEKDFLSKLKGVNPDDIVLMPEGVTSDDLAERSTFVAEEAVKRGWRFTPRLHVLMFGKARAV